MKKIFDSFGTIICILSVAYFVWFFFSWGEIITKNKEPDPQYSKYNMFNVFLEDEK
jgi:hypothetical protein